MGNRSRASRVDGHRARGLLVVLICAAITATVAAAWVMRRTTPHQAGPAALPVTPPRGILGVPRVSVPTADEEGDGTVSRARGVPAGDRLRPSPRSAQSGPPATARLHPPVSKQISPRQAGPSARRQTAQPSDSARQLDAVRLDARPGRLAMPQDPVVRPEAPRANRNTAAQGQAATGHVPGPGVGGEGAGSGAGTESAGSPPAAGEGDRAGGAAGPVDPSTGEPVQLVPPRVITLAGTDYPGEAFRVTVARQDLGSNLVVQGPEGSVRVRALVRADGLLGSVEVAVSSGSAILDRAATEAVRRWVFAPATRNGVPLDAYVTFTIRYVVR
jgi:TonB family protein